MNASVHAFMKFFHIKVYEKLAYTVPVTVRINLIGVFEYYVSEAVTGTVHKHLENIVPVTV